MVTIAIDKDALQRTTRYCAAARRVYLGVYEQLLADAGADGLISQVMIEGQVNRLRRQLGMGKEPDRDRIRAQTRERVRRHRERKRSSG